MSPLRISRNKKNFCLIYTRIRLRRTQHYMTQRKQINISNLRIHIRFNNIVIPWFHKYRISITILFKRGRQVKLTVKQHRTTQHCLNSHKNMKNLLKFITTSIIISKILIQKYNLRRQEVFTHKNRSRLCNRIQKQDLSSNEHTTLAASQTTSNQCSHQT